jgi:hypothetical protein
LFNRSLASVESFDRVLETGEDRRGCVELFETRPLDLLDALSDGGPPLILNSSSPASPATFPKYFVNAPAARDLVRFVFDSITIAP